MRVAGCAGVGVGAVAGAGALNQPITRANSPGAAGAGAGAAAAIGSTGTSRSGRSGAWLAGTIDDTAGFSGSAPGLAICGGGTATTGVMRS